MLGLDLIDPETGELASEHQCREVMRACRERGVLVAAHVPRLRINPPLTVSRAEVDKLFDVLHEVFE
jgi:4-aminobutyrate aminotransferase-like enzyme